MSETSEALLAKLREPFDPAEVRFRPGAVAGGRALALAYVDARAVMDRLDQVMGQLNWQSSYEAMPSGTVICRLKLRFDGEWIEKSDVGGESEQPDGGDRTKSAFSDSLKRAAVHWGIGRYLYRLPANWVDYDPQKKQFKSDPRALLAKVAPRPTATQTKPPEPPRHANGQHAPPERATPIDHEQFNELGRLLCQARITDKKGGPDFRGIAAHFQVQRLSQLTQTQFQEAVRMVKDYDPKIIPPARSAPAEAPA